MILQDILKKVNLKEWNTFDGNVEIEDIVYDSRKAGHGKMFVAMVGTLTDGHKYVQSAYDLGCRVFVVEKNVDLPEDAMVLQVYNSRKALSAMSASFFDNPSEKLTVIGVTGTKGKTSITGYIGQVLNKVGINTGTIGTRGIIYNGKHFAASNTTPESYEIQKAFRQMLDEDVKCVCLEASSIGLKMDRVDDVHFDIGVYTNLSDDHIGPTEHPSFEDYLESKERLFELSKVGIINSDDEYADRIAKYGEDHGCKIVTYGIDRGGSYTALNIRKHNKLNAIGVDFSCLDIDESASFDYTIMAPGKFSVYNALAVIAVCRQMGIPHSKIQETLKTAVVPGRIESISLFPYATVISDYAHNKVSMENLLSALSEYRPKRLIVLFGSVGERTQLRRKQLGKVVSDYADVAIITSEDPGNEDPDAIIDEIESAFEGDRCSIIRIPDRWEAIRYAIDHLEEGDLLVLAGKAEDAYMKIKGVSYPFDEKALAIQYMEERLEREKNSSN